jgi:Lrp/AsnC family transcriptional regulator, leucine-responsive regulatory protein
MEATSALCIAEGFGESAASIAERPRQFVALLRKTCVSLQQMPKIDEIDARILRELSNDAKIPNVRLAAKVGLSPSACLRRVQELERQGIVAGYRARIDGKLLGRSFVAYVMVGLSSQKKAAHAAFERAIRASREVVECHNVTGSVEYLLRVEVHDLAAYKHFHTEILGGLQDVTVITTYVVMASPKDERA